MEDKENLVDWIDNQFVEQYNLYIICFCMARSHKKT